MQKGTIDRFRLMSAKGWELIHQNTTTVYKKNIGQKTIRLFLGDDNKVSFWSTYDNKSKTIEFLTRLKRENEAISSKRKFNLTSNLSETLHIRRNKFDSKGLFQGWTKSENGVLTEKGAVYENEIIGTTTIIENLKTKEKIIKEHPVTLPQNWTDEIIPHHLG